MQNASHRLRQWRHHQGSVLYTVDDYDVLKCETCGFNHIVPIPDDAALQLLYKNNYYADEKPDFIHRQEQDKDWWSLVNNERLEAIERYCSIDNVRSILDIGCGPGLFLDAARKRGWTVRGVEPSEIAAQYSQSKGIDVYHGMFDEEFVAQQPVVDAINLSEVLEHVTDPISLLQRVKLILKPGGIVCIVVPNDFNPVQLAAQRELQSSHWWLVPPHHINYFSFDSLQSLVNKCGFSVVHKESTFPIELFLLMGENYIGNDTVGRACHSKRMQLESALHRQGLSELKQKLYQMFANMNIGREIVLICQLRSAETE